MQDPLEIPNEFYIEFNTEIDPGKLVATKVTLETETITDMDRQLNIGLSDHPLYGVLCEYVRANPR